MQRLPPRERVAVTLWAVIAVVAWNGIYDLLVSRGVKGFLLQAVLHEAGRGPRHSLTQFMEVTVRDAVWVSTLWGCVLLLAGMLTIRVLRRA